MTRRVTLLSVPLLVLALTIPFLYSQQKEKDEEDRDQAQKRAEYFARQRGVAPGKLPSGRRLQAVRQLEGMRAAEQQRRVAPASGIANQATVAGAAANPLSTTPWKSIGPSNVTSGGITWSGRVSAMVVDPRNSLVVYAGAADGGVWKTTNGGQTWTSLTDFQPSLSTGSIALDPANPDIVYVGTGEFNAGDGYPGVGILKSTDGGATWTQMQGPFIPKNVGFRMPAIAVSPANSQIVLAAAFGPNLAISGGVFRSTDGGATWSNVLSANFGATTVVFDPHNISVAYAGIVNADANGAQTVKLMKSTDAGATWSATGLAQASGTRVIATVAPTDSSVYVTYALPSGTQAKMFRSRDGGNTFTELGDASICPNQCSYNLALAVNPTNSDDLFFGALDILRSVDGGANWTFPASTHSDQHALAFSATADRIYAGNDGGMWVSTSLSQVSWASINTNMSTLQFYPGISIGPDNPSFGLGGMQDNGTARYNGTAQWPQVLGADGFSTAIDPATPSTFYFSIQNGSIFKTVDNGATILGINNGLPTIGTFNTVFTLDHLNPSRLYTIRNVQVFQTTDATNWHAISAQMNTMNGLDIEVAPGDSNTVWTTGCCGQVIVSRNAGAGAGATWTLFSGPTKRPLTSIAISPTDPSTAYVVVSGFAADFVGVDQIPGHVFKVTNGGATWTDMTSNLPDVPMSGIVVDPGLANTFYVATDIGVFTTSNAGASWDTVVTNLPRSVVVGLALDPQSRTLRAATHGRGMFDLQLPSATPPPPPPTTCTVPSTAATPSVTICTPTNGSTVSSPVHLAAATKSATTVTTMKVYDNNVQIFSVNAGSVDTNLNLAAGAHKITVNAWNTGGQVFVSTTSITVGTTGGGGTCTAPSTAATPSVTICTPTKGATVSSPVHLTAATKSATTVTTMKVYDNNVQIFSVNAGSVDTNLNLAAGTHNITVNAWNTGGQVFTSSTSITVNGGGTVCTAGSTASTPSVTICTPTSGATVNSPVHLTAATKSASTVTTMKVYDNNVQVFSVNTGKVDTSLNLAVGSHVITVNAWNTGGQVFKSAVTITVH